MRNRTAWIVGLVAGALLLFVGFVYAGVYNVAATSPHTSAVHSLLRTMTARSVAVRANDLSERDIPDLTDTALVRLGSDHFADTCARCHGAPGVERSEMGEGLHPEGPSFDGNGADWTDRELYWIAKNGMKFTGMPAFGPTHSDQDLWSMVAFIRRLPEMSPQEYEEMVGPADEPEGHSHGGPEEEAEAGGHDAGDGHAHD